MDALKLHTKYFFGKKSIFELEKELAKSKYRKALVITGNNSYKENGSFADLEKVLKKLNLDYVHFAGIEPNPKDITLDKCIDFGIHHKIDVIFALGGGSVVDAAKVIATVMNNKESYNSSWEYVINPMNAFFKPIDIISIITLAGTGSENNGTSVISNPEKFEKKSVYNEMSTPIISVQDPSYTFTVNAWQTASGIFDCFSHLLEQYFGKSTFDWTKEFIFANLRVLINYAKMVILRPLHFEARANIFWTTTMALNGLASFKCETDWTVHTIEHAISGLWDVTHGAGLAFVTPTYLEIRSQEEQWFKDKVIQLGRNVFKTQTLESTIKYLVDFIKSINLPTRWTEFDRINKFEDSDASFLLNHCCRFGDLKMKSIYQKVIWKLMEKK